MSKSPNSEMTDHLRLGVSPAVHKMITKEGKQGEEVLFSVKVTKVNRKEKAQTRALLITNLALYNLDPTNHSKCKRRIEIEKIGSITSSNTSEEFVIHIPDEYDYRFLSAHKEEITKVLKKQYKALTNKALKTSYVMEDELGNITWTKDKVKYVPREEQIKLKKQLAAEDHDSDREEQKTDGDVEQIIQTAEKVTIEDFELLKVLGRGSFGKVMMVRKKNNGNIYAMKILKKTMLVARQQVEHTKSERKILETLQHPFLMGLRFAFQTSTKLYLVMDFYKGGELFFNLKTKRRFTEPEARLIVAEVALALGKLHSFNFIYRDLKPENILMDDVGHICLTDFGLSKDVDPDNPEANTFCGTPEYLAPEILKGGAHGKPVDWWSLGILLYELTVGIPPFYSQNVNEMYHKIQHGVLRFPPFLSEECRELITALLNRNPDERMGTSDRDVEELKAHAFFSTIDWDKLYKKVIDPPYKPKVKSGETDTSNFETTFTNEQVVDSVVADNPLTSQENAAFDGFTFVTKGTLH
jgi:serum/glucocorticoid-regulated kinase 2